MIRRYVYYLVAIACIYAGLRIIPWMGWQSVVSTLLYIIAGGLIWAHVSFDTRPRVTPRTRKQVEQARMQEIAKDMEEHKDRVLRGEGGKVDEPLY